MALVEGVVSPLKTENERGMGDRAASRQLRLRQSQISAARCGGV